MYIITDPPAGEASPAGGSVMIYMVSSGLFIRQYCLSDDKENTALVLACLSLDKLHNFHDWNYQYAKADGNQVFFQAYAGKLECVCE